MNRTTAQISEALFRRRMAIAQADALIRQAETQVVTLMAADKGPELKAFANLVRQQCETLVAAADHIIKTQVSDD